MESRHFRRRRQRKKRRSEFSVGGRSGIISLAAITFICLIIALFANTSLWKSWTNRTIKIDIPYKRESVVDPENSERGTITYWIDWNFRSNSMPFRIEVKRNTKHRGLIVDKGAGLLAPEKEKMRVKIRGVDGKGEKRKKGGWQINWSRPMGKRNIPAQNVTPRPDGSLLIQDLEK